MAKVMNLELAHWKKILQTYLKNGICPTNYLIQFYIEKKTKNLLGIHSDDGIFGSLTHWILKTCLHPIFDYFDWNEMHTNISFKYEETRLIVGNLILS